jgi:hypothetical protein
LKRGPIRTVITMLCRELRDAWREAAGSHRALPRGFVRQIRPQLLAMSDRTPFEPRFMFVSSDRTWLPRPAKSLTSANGLPLVDADRPLPVTAVTSGDHLNGSLPPRCDPKWRTFAATSHERNQPRNGWRRIAAPIPLPQPDTVSPGRCARETSKQAFPYCAAT